MLNSSATHVLVRTLVKGQNKQHTTTANSQTQECRLHFLLAGVQLRSGEKLWPGSWQAGTHFAATSKGLRVTIVSSLVNRARNWLEKLVG